MVLPSTSHVYMEELETDSYTHYELAEMWYKPSEVLGMVK